MNPTNHELALALKEIAARPGNVLGDNLVLLLAADRLREDWADVPAPTIEVPQMPEFVGTLMNELPTATVPDAGGWIAWDGSLFDPDTEAPYTPVPRGTLVDVRFRDGVKYERVPAGEILSENRDAASTFWKNEGQGNDIVAYRVVQ